METEIQIYEENDNLAREIVFDRQVITRYTYKGSAKPLIDEINYLKEEMQKLKLSKGNKICLINDEEAKIQIGKLLTRFKTQNIKNIDVIDIIKELNLPVEQIERLMGKLEQEKKVLQNG